MSNSCNGSKSALADSRNLYPLAKITAPLHHYDGHRFALFTKQGGRSPELDREDTLEWIGRFLARIHAVGACNSYHVRLSLDIQHFGTMSRDFLIAGKWLPLDLQSAWISVADQALDCVNHAYQRAGNVHLKRLHAIATQETFYGLTMAPISLTSTIVELVQSSKIYGMFFSGDKT